MVLFGALQSSALATLPPPPPPHHPENAACALRALVSAIDRGDRASLVDGLKIYSGKLGEVTADEFDAFFAEFRPRATEVLRPRDSKRALEGLRLTHWGVLRVAETLPLYVITMAREPVNDGHWSAWLVQFKSDEIISLRRADELWPFADDRHFFGSKDCPEI
jgi:hypothetical protein